MFVREKKFYKSFLLLFIPMVVQSIVSVATNFLDNLMIAGYSEISFAGVGLSNQVQFFLTMIISSGLGGGIVVLISRYWGQKNIGNIKKVLSVALKVSFAISFIMTVVIFLIPNTVLGLFTNETAVIEQGVSYIKIVCFSYVLFALSMAMSQTLNAVESPKIGFIGSLISVFVNLVLNYIFIYGLGPIPSMGASGAALATVIARLCEFIYILIYVLKIDKKIGFKIKDLVTFDKVVFKNFIKISTPLILSGASWGLAMGIQTSILGHMGAISITANEVATQIFQLVTVALGASANASSIIMGKAVGEDNIDIIKKYTRTFQLIFISFGVITGILMFALKDVLIGFYNVSQESYALSLAFVTILSVTCIGTAYQMPALGGIVKGGGDTKFVFINDIIFMWLIVLPAAYISAYVLKLSPVIVFAVLKSDQILKCGVAFFKVNSYNWIKKFDDDEKKDGLQPA